MSTVKADNFTWKSGQAGGLTGTNVTGDQIVYGVAKAWSSLDCVTPVIRKSFNISSINRTGTGAFDHSFTTSMIDTNYSPVGSSSVYSSSSYTATVVSFGDTSSNYGSRTTSTITLQAIQGNNTTYVNPYFLSLSVNR